MKLSKSIFFSLMILSIVSCGQKKDFNSYINTYYNFSVDTISVDGLKKIQDQVQLIDARSEIEYSTSKIKGAMLVDYDNPLTTNLKLNKSDTIVVYCTIGYRSEKIAERFKKEGYKKVYNLYGGIIKWVNDSNPVYAPTGSKTPLVHTYDQSWGKWLTNPKAEAVN
jgi:rhodanese-related sulfurtransferase